MRWHCGACRRFAAQPALALKLIGIELENCMPLAGGVNT